MDFRLFNDNRRDAFRRDFIDEIVAVKFFALDGKEQIAHLRQPRIGADGINSHARRASKNFRAAGFGNKFQ